MPFGTAAHASAALQSVMWFRNSGRFMSNRNLDLLMDAARLLQPMLNQLVFLGGSTTALLITDRAAADVRPTYDVDAIAGINSYAEYTVFSQRMRELGFTEDISEGAPICRWRQETTIIDIMPLD